MKLSRMLSILAVLVVSLGLVTIVLAGAQLPRPRLAIDCVAYENYPGAEPAGYAETCLGPVRQTARESKAILVPDSPGIAHDVSLLSDRVVTFSLNDFAGQTVLFSNTLQLWGYDFDPSGTTLYALDNSGDDDPGTEPSLGILNLTTGNFTVIGASFPRPGHVWSGLTIHPVLGTMYASSTNAAESTLYSIDPSTGVPTEIGTYTAMPTLIDIAINRDGEMYGHEILNDQIFKIDPATGAPTLIGNTGYNANFAQGMDFDNDDGTLYIFLYQGGGQNVYGTVNLSTGAVTPLEIDNPLGEFEGATQTTARELILDKTVGLDPNVCTETDSIDILSGTEVFYCYEVTNSGDITRTLHNLVDSALGAIRTSYPYTLTPGSSLILTQTAIITETTVNTATWTAFNAGPSQEVSSTAVAMVHVPPPSITLTKTVGLEPNTCSTFDRFPIPPEGAEVTYCFEAKNTGLITLTLHDLMDDHLGIIRNDLAYTLTPGASFWVTATAHITEQTVNTATWTAFNPGPVDIAVAEDGAEVFIAPGIGCSQPAERFEYGVPLAGGWLTQTTTGPVFWATTANENACKPQNGVNNTPGDGYAACADADQLNLGAVPYDTELWSNSFSLTATAEAALQFAAAYDDPNAFLVTDIFDVDVSTDDGLNWTNVLRWNETHAGEIVNLSLNSYLGEENVRVRFRYHNLDGGWDYWVHLDDVEVRCGDPTIELVKTVGTDPQVCSTEDVLTVNETTMVHYCYEVTNQSGITLSTHDLADSALGTILSEFPYDLTPGSSLWLTQTATISQTTINTATWTAATTGPLLFTGTDTTSATVVVEPIIDSRYFVNLPAVLKHFTH